MCLNLSKVFKTEGAVQWGPHTIQKFIEIIFTLQFHPFTGWPPTKQIVVGIQKNIYIYQLLTQFTDHFILHGNHSFVNRNKLQYEIYYSNIAIARGESADKENTMECPWRALTAMKDVESKKETTTETAITPTYPGNAWTKCIKNYRSSTTHIQTNINIYSYVHERVESLV